jgi:hypothetical protein
MFIVNREEKVVKYKKNQTYVTNSYLCAVVHTILHTLQI